MSACTSNTALGMLANAASQRRSQEVLASRPDRPCQAQKKGCPALVVLVAYAVACKPWVLNCIEPQRTRCASPKRMLLRVHARIAPKVSLVVSSVSLQQTQRSHARSKDKGRGTASRLSYASTCFAYEVTKLFCVQS